MEGRREEMSKLAGDSRSNKSTFMVRQFIVPMIAREQERGVAWSDPDLLLLTFGRIITAKCYDSGNIPLGFNSFCMFNSPSKHCLSQECCNDGLSIHVH